jgi:sortase A
VRHDVHYPAANADADDAGVGTLSSSERAARRRARQRPPVERLERVPVSPARAAVATTLATIAGLAVWFLLYAVFLSGLQEGHDQHLLYAQIREGLAAATVPFGGRIAPGTAVAVMDAPAIGLHAVVVEGTSSKDLTSGPGHFPSSPMPGQAGNSVIYGRSAIFGAPFAGVRDLEPGDLITVTTGQGAFGFRVLDVRLPGDPLPSVTDLGQASLTLVTSAGTGWRSGWAPYEVIYADATLVQGKVQPAPPGRPGISPGVDNPLASDSSDVVLFQLFLELLVMVLLCVGFAYAYTRWSAWQLWLVAMPLVVAGLWLVTGTVALLLPNLT